MSFRRIGSRYQLERKIAGGGMGAIWVALDSQLKRRVALKLMAPERIDSYSARHQFEREAMAIAQLRNPHVVQVHDYGVDGDTPYIVMELLEGEDLEARLERQGRLEPAVVASLLNQIARALASAHASGVIHRDLKPANLFLARGDGEEVVKVLDFGLARWEGGASSSSSEQPGQVMGTLRYMSPEQMRGDARVDHRTDLWSFAVVAYRALTGRFPFSADALGEMSRGRAVAEPPSQWVPELGQGVDAFFARALHVEPSRRFQSARELASAFAELLEKSRPARAAKIMVIDDEPDVELLMRQRFRKQLRDAVYEFVFASDGEDALAKLRQHPDTQVILSDINMPRMDGLTFLARVGEVNPLAKVIMVSAYSNMGNIRVAMNHGAFDFLVKPIDFQDLEATLTKALKQVTELRQMVRSAEENHLLRMFVNGGILDRMAPLMLGPDLVDGERMEATVAFLDLKDFTPITGKAQPEAVIRRLNANFEVIVAELLARGGLVDKFVGDAVMAVFQGPGHLRRGLEACLAARLQLRAMAFRYGEDSPYVHGVNMGLDSGELICGSIGAKGLGQLDYTVLGTTVNTAARLAVLADKDQLLIAEHLQARVEEEFECRALGSRLIPGSALPLGVQEVVARREQRVSSADRTASIEENVPHVHVPARLVAKKEDNTR
ncbi:protein kinase domain-containing protein [Archangium primigenium]|uniref:protein kinase domain-containing protein n=1 Tax=[Archangium] primigenium TaxID=2792470 RepID=UPI00195BFB7B|nr:protein kinase [Archangium primigenium]MBM7114456.1 protein kinase [Archangium primigenium]